MRQYSPELTYLSTQPVADLLAAEERLDNRPRKRLDWRTPAHVFAAGAVAQAAQSQSQSQASSSSDAANFC